MKRRLVRVEWCDPFSHDGWCELDQLQTGVLWIESVGYEVLRTKEVIVLALNVDVENGKVSCATVIPLVCVRSRKVL